MALSRGDIVQIDRSHGDKYGGSLAVVRSLDESGAVLTAFVPREDGFRRESFRASLDQMTKVGHVMGTDFDDVPVDEGSGG